MKSRHKKKSSMPKLPIEQPRNSELLQKSAWKTGVIGQRTAPIFKPFSPSFFSRHKKLLAVFTLFLLILVALSVVVVFFPSLLKPGQKEEEFFEYPVETANIQFPSDFLKEKFLENFRKAKDEKSQLKQYEFFAENFKMLRGFYLSTAAYDNRVALEKYEEYMRKNYPNQVIGDAALYDYPCIDKLCEGEVKYATQIESIRSDLSANTVINAEVRDQILRNIEAAVASSEKNDQFSSYATVLSMVKSEVERTNDDGLRAIHGKMSDFLKSNYSDFEVPKSLQL